MDQLVGFLLHPPLSEIGKKIGKMLKYTPTFKVLSAPLSIVMNHDSGVRYKSGIDNTSQLILPYSWVRTSVCAKLQDVNYTK